MSILATTSLRGEFPPASALGEVSLASRFKASRGTVREALRVLSKQGLVEMQSRRGGAVPPRSPERAREIFSLRAVLESFAVKLALTEPESGPLAQWLAARPEEPLVSSTLHRAEVPRAVWLAEPGALPRSYRVIRRIARVALTPDVLDNSATLPPQGLGPALAIHLASALALKHDLTAFVAYDERLLAAAAGAGLPVASPA